MSSPGALAVARFTCLLATGLLAGLLFEFWVFTAPALATLPGPVFVEVTQAIDRRYQAPIPILYVIVNFSALAVLLLTRRRWRSAGFMLTAAALAATLAATASTLLVNVPINAQVINSWSAQSPPADWAEVRDRWDLAHAFRTILVLIAFACQLVAVLRTDRRDAA